MFSPSKLLGVDLHLHACSSCSYPSSPSTSATHYPLPPRAVLAHIPRNEKLTRLSQSTRVFFSVFTHTPGSNTWYAAMVDEYHADLLLLACFRPHNMHFVVVHTPRKPLPVHSHWPSARMRTRLPITLLTCKILRYIRARGALSTRAKVDDEGCSAAFTRHRDPLQAGPTVQLG